MKKIPTKVGRVEEWGDVQWPFGELRQLDEHSPTRGDLHVAGASLVFWLHGIYIEIAS